MPIITKAKGKDTTMANLCSMSSPPSIMKTTAKSAWITPHMILLKFLGFRLPLDVNIPSTYTAEFADVIKKVKSKNIQITENNTPPG